MQFNANLETVEKLKGRYKFEVALSFARVGPVLCLANS